MPDLRHIPGPSALPLIGQTLGFLRDPYGTYFGNRARFGDVFRLPIFGQTWVVLAGPDALEEVLMNRQGIYSTQQGLAAFAPFFSGGLLHRDGPDHRAHRRVMQAAFRSEAMRGYLNLMNEQISRTLDQWPTGRKTRLAPRAKDLTLGLSAHVFMGLTDRAEIGRINAAFIREVRGTAGILRLNLPFTPYGRGIRARAELTGVFQGQITKRRANPGGDFFSQMCIALDEDGQGWTDQEITDHFNFLLVAAHDAVTGVLTVMISALVQDLDLQERLRAEVDALPPGPLAFDDLPKLPLTERTMNEALRVHAPSAFTARMVTEDSEWQGHKLPAGTTIAICPGPVMMDRDIWRDPQVFDPDRFGPERAEDQVHKFAFSPYGGGVHKCIGLHFGVIQTKAIMVEILRRFRIGIEAADVPTWRQIPTPQPRNGLPITLTPL